jgi:hypothetical protein
MIMREKGTDRGRHTTRGFTLLEATMAIGISCVIAAGFYAVYNQQHRQYVSEQMNSDIQSNARFMIDSMERDLLLTGYSPTTPPGISVAEHDRISFEYWDDKATDIPPYDKHRRVTYEVSPDSKRQLLRKVQRYNPSLTPPSYDAGQTYVIGDNVLISEPGLTLNQPGLTLKYFNSANSEMLSHVAVADLANIRRIDVSLAVSGLKVDPLYLRPDPLNLTKPIPTKRQVTLTRTFQPRNLGTTSSPIDNTPPAPPTGLAAVDPGVCGELRVRWDASPETDAGGYILYVGQETGVYTSRYRITNPATNTYTLTGLTSTKSTAAVPTTYRIALTAFDRSNNMSNLSTEVSGNPVPSVASFGGGDDTTINPAKPLPPASFDARKGADEGSVTLSWAASPSAGIVKYLLHRSLSPSFTPTGTVPNTGTCIADLNPSVLTYTDSGLLGCTTYYYKITAVNCDETLLPSYTAAEYRNCFGDGPGTVIAADYPTPTLSDTTPADTQPVSESPVLSSKAGWKRVFVNLTNPNFTNDPDFTYTKVWFNRGAGYPTFLADSCNVDGTTGTLVPDNNGIFTQPGSGGPNAFKHDSETLANPPEPELANLVTYYYLAVSYDRCGNCSAVTQSATTLSELCGDDPPGLPQCDPPISITTSTEGCGGYARLAWTGDCLKDGTTTNFDFSGFHLYRNEGKTFSSGTATELTGGVPTWNQSFTDATALPGKFYSYAVKWADCAYEHSNGGNISNPNVNGGLLEGVALGELMDDSSLPVLSGDLTLYPPTYEHNNVRFYVKNTSAGDMALKSLNLEWANPFAFLQSIVIGDNATTPRETVWENPNRPTPTPPPIPITLSSTILAGDMSLNVSSLSGLASPGVILIDAEKIFFSYAYGSTLSGLTRGVGGTTPATHLSGTRVTSIGYAQSLMGTLDATTTVIPVYSTANLNISAGNFLIDSEEITCSAKTSYSLTGCERGVNGTTAAPHMYPSPVIQYFPPAGSLPPTTAPSPLLVSLSKRILGLDDRCPVDLYFTKQNGSVDYNTDMRNDTLIVQATWLNTTTQDTGCNGTATIPIPSGPAVTWVTQNAPVFGTPSWPVPGVGGANPRDQVVVPGGLPVTVNAFVEDNSEKGIKGVTLYYYTDNGATLSAPPVYNGGNYIPLAMTFVSGTLWKLSDLNRIPARDNSSTWYFIVAEDNDGNFERKPENRGGAYQYFQQQTNVCGNTPQAPSLWGWTSGETVTLEWTAPDFNTDNSLISDLAGYKVYRYDGLAWSLLKTLANPATLTTTDSPPGISQEYSSLSAAITATATSIPAASTTGFPTSGAIWIDSEQITYTGLTTTSFTGCTRGANGTDPLPHSVGTSIYYAGKTYTYYVTAYDMCTPTAKESVASNIFTECIGAPPSLLTVHPTVLYPGDPFTVNLTVCGLAGNGQPYEVAYIQDCSTLGLDADPIRLQEDGDSGVFTIDPYFPDYRGRLSIKTWSAAGYPAIPTDLDLKVGNGDTITVQSYKYGFAEPIWGTTCQSPSAFTQYNKATITVLNDPCSSVTTPGAPVLTGATRACNTSKIPQVRLNWTAPTIGPVTKYQIFRCNTTSSSGCTPTSVVAETAGTVLTYLDTITAVTSGTVYYNYLIKAVNGSCLTDIRTGPASNKSAIIANIKCP